MKEEGWSFSHLPGQKENKEEGKSFTSPGAKHKQARQKHRLEQPTALHTLKFEPISKIRRKKLQRS
jgi:hypothetical protein